MVESSVYTLIFALEPGSLATLLHLLYHHIFQVLLEKVWTKIEDEFSKEKLDNL